MSRAFTNNGFVRSALGNRCGQGRRAVATGGVSLIAIMMACGTAMADCTVDGATTTCVGDISSGASATTPNVVVRDVTADITPAGGVTGLSMPGVSSFDVTLGDHTITTVNAPGVFADQGPGDLVGSFQGSVQTSGQGFIHGIVSFRPEQPGSKIDLTSFGDITVNATQTQAGTSWQVWGIVANGGPGTSDVVTTGDVSSSSTGPSEQTGALGSFGQSGATLFSTGNLFASAENGVAFGISAAGGPGGLTVSSEGNITVSSVSANAIGIGANSRDVTRLMSTGDIEVATGGAGVGQPGHAIGVTGMDNAVVSAGDITVTGHNGRGIFAGGPVYFENNALVVATADSTHVSSEGNISTTGDGGLGISAQGHDASVTSTGDVTTKGAGSAGIQALRSYLYNVDTGEETRDITGASAMVNSAGAIATQGRLSSAILAGGLSASVGSEGDLWTQGEASPAILSLGDIVTVESTGDIMTGGFLSGGIVAMKGFTYPPPGGQEIFDYGAQSVTISSVGNIVTTGEGSIGIGAGALQGAATVVSQGDIATAQINSGAIFALGKSASITSSGNITTAGAAGGVFGPGGGALFAHSSGGASGVDTASITSTGNISTSGAGAKGMLALALAPQDQTGGDAVIASTGNVSTTGESAQGIFALGIGGSAAVDSTGNVTTSGGYSTAIQATSNGTARATSVGDLTTSGYASSGMFVFGPVSATLSSTGNVATALDGSSALVAGGVFEPTDQSFSPALAAAVASAGDLSTSGFDSNGVRALGESVTVSSEGDISTHGDLSAGILALRNVGFDANDQVFFDYAADSVSVVSNGDISTSGAGSAGIVAGAIDGTASVENTGDISTLGANSGAIYATGKSASITSTGNIATAGGGQFLGPGGGALFAQSVAGAPGTDIAEIVSAGDISTQGDFAMGLLAIAGNPQGGRPAASSIVSVGDVTTTGLAGTGIFAGGGDAEVTSTGDISAAGDYAKGILVGANVTDGVAVIRSTGDVTMTGSIEAMALLATGGHVTIDSVGDITTTGQGSYGIMAAGAFQLIDGGAILSAASKTVNISTNGAVTVTGAGTAGIVALGDVVDIEVDGAVTSDYVGVLIGDNVQDLQSGSNPDAFFSIVNRGSIAGSEVGVFSALRTTLTNAGTLDSASGVDALLSDYDDTLILLAGSSYDGFVQGAAGDDTAILRGPDLTAASGQTVGGLAGFETLDVESGYWSNAGVIGEVGAVNIASGATLSLADVQSGADTLLALTTAGIVTDGTLSLNFGNSDALDEFATNTPISGQGGVRLDGPAVLTIDQAVSAAFAGPLTVANGGLLLTGSYDGDVATTGEGVFQLGEGGTAGNFTGDLVNDGTFIFNRSDDYSMVGDFSGSGLLSKRGAGLLTFAGDYDFDGKTEIVDGGVKFAGQIDPEADFELGDGGALDVSGQNQTIGGLQGGGQSSVNVDGGELTVSQAENTTFQGTISGGGGLVKTGGGTLNLTGTNTYTGTTQVTGGKLAVNGSIVSLVVLNSGGTLGGNGTVGTVNAGAGGVVAPGNSIGRLTVAGDLTFGPGSIYEVETNAAGQADRLDATGQATIAPTATVQVLAENGNYARRTDYTILTANGGVNGTFGSVTSNLAFLTPRLGYATNAVTLSLYRNDVNFIDAAITPNQVAVAPAAQALGIGAPLFDEILVQSEVSARAAFDQLSGEIYDSTLAGVTGDARHVTNAMLNGVRGAGEGSFVWAEALGVWGKAGSVDFSATMDRELTGFLGGGGYRMGSWTLGAAGGITNSEYQFVGRADSSDANTGLVGIYAGYQAGGWNATLGGSAAWHDMSTSRSIAAGAITATPVTDYDGETTQVFAELSYAVPAGAWTLEPFGRLAYVNTTVDRIAEAAGPASLVVDADQTATFRTIGVEVSGALGAFRPRASLGWQHVSNGNSVTSAHFTTGAQSFVVNGSQLPTDAAVLDLGFDTDVGGFTVGASYIGTLAGEWQDHGVKVVASFQF